MTAYSPTKKDQENVVGLGQSMSQKVVIAVNKMDGGQKITIASRERAKNLHHG
jgi:hypothetical protein